MIIRDDYIDEDVGYLVGMLLARGEITRSGNTYNIIINIPYSDLETDNLSERNDLIVSVDQIINRIGELSDRRPEKLSQEDRVVIKFKFERRNILWRDLNYLLEEGKSYKNFDLPDEIFEATKSIQKEVVRGMADVGGKVRRSNRYFKEYQHRVYLDFMNSNWMLPVKFFDLLQMNLNVPVHTIAWGHPNIRDPKLKDYNSGKEKAWAREHQLKIFANAFEEIGFHIDHKQEMLEKLARECEEGGVDPTPATVPGNIREETKEHPMEDSEKIPEEIRGKHYDAWWQILCDLGSIFCAQQRDLEEFGQ